MFRHRGKTRTLAHNLKLASLLSFVAGMVNVAGFLSVQKLTTNVTGHFAFFVDEVFKLDAWMALVYFLYIFFFFLGSFVSNFLIELTSRHSEKNIYTIPVFIECAILFSVGFLTVQFTGRHGDIIAFSLLFAMGLQNSFVTMLSKATVRTTHLTGLFTDLGIELSQLFFYKHPEHRQKLFSSIRLRLTIIFFFFTGGILGGVCYARFNNYVFVFAGVILAAALVYDQAKFKIILLRRRMRGDESH